MKNLAYFFIGLGTIDFLASVFGYDLYSYLGIYLTGLAYKFSPLIAGLIGIIILQFDSQKDKQHEIESILNSDEEIVISQLVNVQAAGAFSSVEHGIFFVTNERVGYVRTGGTSSIGIPQMDSSDEGNNFSCPLQSITSVNSSLTSVQVSYKNEIFKFMPGPTKVKKIAKAIQELM